MAEEGLSEEKHFLVTSFQGKLGLGINTALVITDIPESSVCHGSGLPLGVSLTSINNIPVRSQNDLREVLGRIAGETQVVLSCKLAGHHHDNEEQRKWWGSIVGTYNPDAPAQDEDSDHYNPIETELDLAAPIPVAAEDDDEYNPDSAEVQEALKDAAPPGDFIPFNGVSDNSRKRGRDDDYYGNDGSDREGSDCEEEDDGVWNAPQQKRQAPEAWGGGDCGGGGGGEGAGWPAEGEAYDPPDGLHPCPKFYKRCPPMCNLQCFPADACIPFIRSGQCHHGMGCWNLHCRVITARGDMPYSCELCGLKLQREADYTHHMESRAHQGMALSRAAVQQKANSLRSTASDLLNTLQSLRS